MEVIARLERARRSQRVRAAMLGLLCADAVGVPYEFKRPSEIPLAYKIEISTYAGKSPRAHAGTPQGTWSDDGAGALALAAACNGATPVTLLRRLADNLIAWRKRGVFAVDARVFDIGNATARAIDKLENGCDPLHSGGSEPSSNGNGSLMRALPLAFAEHLHANDLVMIARLAMSVSAVTHAHPLSMISCAIYTVIANRLFMGDAPMLAIRKAFETTSFVVGPSNFEAFESELARFDEPTGSGYVVDSLAYALKCVRESDAISYVDAVRGAVRLGSDTDTTAAIAGGLSAIIFTFEPKGVPARWIDALRGKDIAEPIIARATRTTEAMNEELSL